MVAFVRLLESIYKVHFIERETSTKTHVVLGEMDKDTDDYKTRLCLARILDENR